MEFEEEEYIKFKTAKLASKKGFDIISRYGMEASLYNKDGEHTFYANYGFMYSGLSKGYIPAPSQSLLRKWLREKHGIHIEMIIDGWGKDTKVSKKNLCYRSYIWQIGKPKPDVNDDLGAGKFEEILEKTLVASLKLI
jgi:hypothetical protein